MHPDTPADGLALTDLFGRGPAEIAQMVAALQAEARRLGLDFGDRSMTFNSRSAQILGKWAADNGHESEFRRAVYDGYFAQGRNIADPGVLADLVRSAGLDPAAAIDALKNARYIEAVDADWRRSMDMGVRAVPTIAMGDRMITGAYPTDTIRDFIQGAAA